GRDPLLVQAGSGNTSMKLDGVLWIKASGKWMADADRDDMFVSVSLAEAGEPLQLHTDLVVDSGRQAAQLVSASIETFMHAVVPHRVVVHVHSVNTIAWAVREDAESELAQRLSDCGGIGFLTCLPGVLSREKWRRSRPGCRIRTFLCWEITD